MRRAIPAAVLLAIGAACSPSRNDEVVRTDQAAASSSAGFCRSTTCVAPRDYPKDGLCEPPDWPQLCAAQGKYDVPLWWRSGCVGWSLQRDSGRHVSYEDARSAIAAAFDAWTTRACPTDGSGPSHPSIDARDLGPVACGTANYDRYGPNQNVVVFHDDAWPHASDADALPDGRSRTIALTTVSFDSKTGEIYDADLEINSGQHNVVPLAPDTPLDGDTFDLQAVLTHEIGHFLGTAHSPSRQSVMFADDEGSDIAKRVLREGDIAGICAMYRPDGARSVATSVDPSGLLQRTACDPTPRRGLTQDCRQDDPPGACSSAAPPKGGRIGWAIGAAALGGILVRRRRRTRIPPR
jgi:MYXO-CTERM domain-containing protein